MKKPNRNIRPLVALLLLSLACAGAARGQQRAYKVDESDYTRCDLSELPYVTDETAAVFVALGRRPGAKVAVVVYAPRPGEAKSYARHVGEWMSRREGVEKPFEVYGGFSEKRRIELWLVPAGAEPPPSAPAVARGGVTLFDTYNYWGGNDCRYERAGALEIFAETLQRLPGWRGTLVVRPHLNRRGLTPGDEGWDEASMSRRKALRQAARDRLHLVRQLGLDPARIKVVVGARSDEWSRAELWLIPPADAARGGR